MLVTIGLAELIQISLALFTLIGTLIYFITRIVMGQIKELITSTEQIKTMQHESISQTTGIKKDIEALTNDVHDLKNANSALAKATSELSTKVAVLEEWRKHVEFKK